MTSHHMSYGIVGQKRQSMPCQNLLQADAGERGLPALTSDPEEGFNNSFWTQQNVFFLLLLSCWMISYQTLQGTPMEAAAWSKNVKMSTWKFCYRRLLHPSLDFKENSSLMKLVVSGSRVLEQITPGMGKPCWGMPPPPESVHTLRRNPKKINLRFCAEPGGC